MNSTGDGSRDFAGQTPSGSSADLVSAATNHVLVAILAAGASRRLGQPKQLVMLAGEPLVRRQCRMAIESQTGSIAVILGCYADECAAAIVDLSITPMINQSWSEGLASSIRHAAQAAIDMDAAGLLLLHVDQYRLMAEDLQSLYAAWKESPQNVCVAKYDDTIGPPVIFPRHCFSKLLKLNGDVGARRVIAELPAAAVLRVNIRNASHDLDEPSQLAALLDATDSPRKPTAFDER